MGNRRGDGHGGWVYVLTTGLGGGEMDRAQASGIRII